MSTTAKPSPSVLGVEKFRVTYEKRTWFIFSWFVRVHAESIGKDLVISASESFDKVFLNGRELK